MPKQYIPEIGNHYNRGYRLPLWDAWNLLWTKSKSGALSTPLPTKNCKNLIFVKFSPIILPIIPLIEKSWVEKAKTYTPHPP
jgi:hypothetical protein